MSCQLKTAMESNNFLSRIRKHLTFEAALEQNGNMPPPSLLTFSNYRTFLEHFVAWKKLQSSSWSLGVWSAALGLSGTASISRVISGDRIPGEELTAALVKYFKFNQAEEGYFQKLIFRERYYRDSELFPQPELIIRNARALHLIGAVDEKATQKLLEAHSLVPILINSTVVASVNVHFYPDSTFGAFQVSHVCIAAKPRDGGFLDSGLFFTNFFCDTEVAQTKFSEVWQQAYKLEKIKWIEDSTKLEIQSQDQLYFLLSKERVSTRIEEKYEVYGYSSGPKDSAVKSKFTIDTIGREYLYDRSLDQANLSSNSQTSALMKDLHFQPLKWVLHENLFSFVYSPEKLAGSKSY